MTCPTDHFYGRKFFLLTFGAVLYWFEINLFIIALIAGVINFLYDTFVLKDRICIKDVLIWLSLSVLGFTVAIYASSSLGIPISELHKQSSSTKLVEGSLFAAYWTLGLSVSEAIAVVVGKLKKVNEKHA